MGQMSKGSSPRGDTTKNTYIDLGASTDEAYRISASSRALAREAIGDENREDRIRQRCSVAVGDFGMADLLRFCHKPVEAGLAALEKKSPIIADIRMVQVGIQKKGHESPVLCALDYGGDLARQPNNQQGRDRLPGKTLDGSSRDRMPPPCSQCEMIREVRSPGLVIGIPVGSSMPQSRGTGLCPFDLN
jgi:precorrin-8X/cobalt-precorrin-8 methylmutase